MAPFTSQSPTCCCLFLDSRVLKQSRPYVLLFDGLSVRLSGRTGLFAVCAGVETILSNAYISENNMIPETKHIGPAQKSDFEQGRAQKAVGCVVFPPSCFRFKKQKSSHGGFISPQSPWSQLRVREGCQATTQV